MIVEERMRTYINSLDMGNTPFLEELEKKALAGRVPIIRKEMQSFLKMFLAATRPHENPGGRNGSRLFHTSDVRIRTCESENHNN